MDTIIKAFKAKFPERTVQKICEYKSGYLIGAPLSDEDPNGIFTCNKDGSNINYFNPNIDLDGFTKAIRDHEVYSAI